MSALGFIETKGLLAAIEGADAMLKAADVQLLEKNLVGGGLVTITVAGEVSAVKASVDAGVAAIGRIGGAALVSQHVIARHDEGLAKIIATKKPSPEVVEAVQAPSASVKAEVEVPAESGAVAEQAEEEPVQVSEAKVEPSEKEEAPRYEISEFKKMKINRLRQIAKTIPGLSLTHAEIKTATKKALIESIINSYRQIEE